MSKEAHGWEFFKSMFNDDLQPSLFNETEKVRLKKLDTMNAKAFKVSYQDVFVSSTDYETATDYLSHDVAKIISNMWMTKCGIPCVLRGIVMETCYKPRRVMFSASGPIATLGIGTDEENLRYILTTRGVLMGDPLTKPCLHIINILTREIAKSGHTGFRN